MIVNLVELLPMFGLIKLHDAHRQVNRVETLVQFLNTNRCKANL